MLILYYSESYISHFFISSSINIYLIHLFRSSTKCSRPLSAVLYSTLPQVSSIDTFVLFLQSLNSKYPHLFSVTPNFANLTSRLLCHIARLGLATHIFAPESR